MLLKHLGKQDVPVVKRPWFRENGMGQEHGRQEAGDPGALAESLLP